MSERMGRYIRDARYLTVDSVLQAYASWLHQESDEALKLAIVEQACKSLQILLHVGLKDVQDIPTAISLYVKGLPHVKKLQKENTHV